MNAVGRHLLQCSVIRGGVTLLGAVLLGCAHAYSPACSTWALGEHASAACYGAPPAPALLPAGSVQTEQIKREIDRTFPGSDEVIRTTVTTPIVSEAPLEPPLLQRSEGADIGKATAGVLRLMLTTVGSAAWALVRWMVGAP